MRSSFQSAVLPPVMQPIRLMSLTMPLVVTVALAVYRDARPICSQQLRTVEDQPGPHVLEEHATQRSVTTLTTLRAMAGSLAETSDWFIGRPVVGR
jgi:hypothetical protein